MNTVEQQRIFDVDAGGRSCVVCGCTDNAACEDGCAWKQPRTPDEPPVCTGCCGIPITDLFPDSGPASAGGWQRCPLEDGHPAPHVFYRQTVQPGEKRRKNGVQIIDQEGTVLAMVDLRGEIDPLTVRAALGYPT